MIDENYTEMSEEEMDEFIDFMCNEENFDDDGNQTIVGEIT